MAYCTPLTTGAGLVSCTVTGWSEDVRSLAGIEPLPMTVPSCGTPPLVATMETASGAVHDVPRLWTSTETAVSDPLMPSVNVWASV